MQSLKLLNIEHKNLFKVIKEYRDGEQKHYDSVRGMRYYCNFSVGEKANVLQAIALSELRNLHWFDSPMPTSKLSNNTHGCIGSYGDGLDISLFWTHFEMLRTLTK